jgi:hypothetical protein
MMLMTSARCSGTSIYNSKRNRLKSCTTTSQQSDLSMGVSLQRKLKPQWLLLLQKPIGKSSKNSISEPCCQFKSKIIRLLIFARKQSSLLVKTEQQKSGNQRLRITTALLLSYMILPTNASN